MGFPTMRVCTPRSAADPGFMVVGKKQSPPVEPDSQSFTNYSDGGQERQRDLIRNRSDGKRGLRALENDARRAPFARSEIVFRVRKKSGSSACEIGEKSVREKSRARTKTNAL
jgi:hypothetical protein